MTVTEHGNFEFDDEQISEEFDYVDEDMTLEDESVDFDEFDEDDDYDNDSYSEEDYDDFGADDMGTEVDLIEEGLADEEEDDYQIIGANDKSFLNSNGDIVVMDPEDNGDNFELKYIPIENISVVTRIRKSKMVEDLVQSIRSTGLIEPIVVAPLKTEDLYVLIAGYRRLLACARAGIRNVPAVVNRKVTTTEIPILEALYNHCSRYSMKEIVDYIDYLEKEKGIVSASMIEYLLQLDNGDYAKLKDILEDDDDDIVSKLMEGQITIAQAFKNLENRRKKESKEEKDLKKTAKVYADAEESGASQLADSGESGNDDIALTDEEIESLAFSMDDINDVEDKSLEEMVKEGYEMEGYEHNKQDRDTDNDRIAPEVRKAVIARDNCKCVICGFGGPGLESLLDVHHVIGVAQGQKDDPDLCVSLCITDHMAVECWAYGKLPVMGIDKMDEEEQVRIKKIIKLGNKKREAMIRLGKKREQIKEEGKKATQLRRMPGAIQPKS